MRITPMALGLLCITSLSACGSPSGKMEAVGKAAHPHMTSIGWVLEDAGKDGDGQTLTHVSVYADTFNDKGELERTNLFEVETMPGCEKKSNDDVRCATDEFNLKLEASGVVTFGHRTVATGDGAAFEVLHTFETKDFSGTPLKIGPSRTTQAPK